MSEATKPPDPQRKQQRLRHRMASAWRPRLMQGIMSDVKGRLPLYTNDWQEGLNCNIRILAPATYIFFASAIPALAFGQQISAATGGVLTVVHILTATAITGLIQSVIGGQPLLIVGVSEPITLIYGYCYSFANDRAGLGQEYFLAWMAWVCVWTAAMLFVLAVLNACDYTDRFTRLSGELFGMLIAVLFMQQAIKGTLKEFRPDNTPLSASSAVAGQFQWRLANGLWALFLAFGTVLTSLKVETARSWRFLTGPLRSFLADYGVVLCVVLWSCLSYALQGAPPGVPRRLTLPNTWDVTTTWTVTGRMGEVPGTYMAGALIPALIIAILFYFDHTVSAQMAQLAEFNLRKPPAYHYDLFLLGWTTLLCGLLGLPPVNGVLPQAPLHTKSLITLKQQTALAAVHRAALEHDGSRAQLLEKMAKECQKKGAFKAAEAILTLDSFTDSQEASMDCSASAGGTARIEAKVVQRLPMEAQEQRVTNLIQSLLVAACLGITPGIKKIPTSVLWGYFAYLAIASLPGSQFWERILLIFVQPSRRPPKFEGAADAPWLSRVRWRAVIAFTLFQAAYCGIVYGITWIPMAGVVFPVPILLLIPAREYILPCIFGRQNLAALDPALYEDVQEACRTRPTDRDADFEAGRSEAQTSNHANGRSEVSQPAQMSRHGSGGV